METARKIIGEMKEMAAHPYKTIVKSMEETGKKAVGCFPIYAPEEIVYAAGALPVGMWGGQTTGNLSTKYYQTFCCSLIKANTEQGLMGLYDILSAVIITAFCDTLKCTIENWKTAMPHLNIIPIVYPQNRKTAEGLQFLREEYLRIIKEIERILDVTISPEALEESLSVYEDYRETMRTFVDLAGDHPDIIDASTRHQIIKAGYFLDKKDYTDKIKKVIRELSNRRPVKENYKKIVVTGLLAEPVIFLDLFAENNLAIVADDLAQESRQFRTKTRKKGKALDRLAERIVFQDSCAFLYDYDKNRIQLLIDLKENYKADGIVYCQLKFCDPEEFDYPIIKKEMDKRGIPLLYLEIEQQMDSIEQLRTRIQTFAEIL